MTAVTHDGSARVTSGLAVAVLSAASFGLAGSLASGLMGAGWSAAAAVAVRILLPGLVLAPFAAVALRGRWQLLRRNAGTVAAYGLVAVAGCQFAFFNAVARMPVGVALLIEYTAPVAIVGWLWLRKGQRPNRLTAVGGVLGIAGLLLVLDVLSGGAADAVGVLWALGSMVCVTVYFLLSSRSDHGLPGLVLATGGLLVGGVALLLAGTVGIIPLAATTAPVVFAGFTTSWWLPVLALGLVTAGLAYLAGIAAARRLGSRMASFVGLLEVLAALVFAWLLLGEAPRPVQALGGLLVLAGVVVVKLGEGRSVEVTAPAPVAAPGQPASGR